MISIEAGVLGNPVVKLGPAAWNDLRKRVSGDVVLPGVPRYLVDRKLFNISYDPMPLAIVFCRTEEDVRQCLRFVTHWNLRFTLRSGGHSITGYSSMDNGVVIDLSGLNSISVDVENKTAVVGTGVTFDQLNKVLDAHQLHVPAGECDSVCIGGFVQGGGFGFTSRTYGMNCDNVISMRVMLADGLIITASREANADLLWALCGGTGCNFGVLLSVEYQLHAMKELCGWALAWPLETASDRENAVNAMMILQKNYMKTGVPKELNTQVMVCGQAPDESIRDLKPWLLIRGTYVGPQEEAEQFLQPLMQAPGAIRQYVITAPFATINGALLNKVPQFPVFLGKPKQRKRARYVERDLTKKEWLSLFEHYIATPNVFSYLCLEVYGGAINSQPIDKNAFIHRNAAFCITLGVFWIDEREKEMVLPYLEEWCEVVKPFWNGHIYQNYPSRESFDYSWCYWGEAYPRLQLIKGKYDPKNKFRFEQSIRLESQEACHH